MHFFKLCTLLTACRIWITSSPTMPTCEPWTCPTTAWRPCPPRCRGLCGTSERRGTIYARWTKTTLLTTGTWKCWTCRTTSWREWSSSTTRCRVSELSTSVTTGFGLCPRICHTTWKTLTCRITISRRSFLDLWIGCRGWPSFICMLIASPGWMKGYLISWQGWRWWLSGITPGLVKRKKT